MPQSADHFDSQIIDNSRKKPIDVQSRHNGRPISNYLTFFAYINSFCRSYLTKSRLPCLMALSQTRSFIYWARISKEPSSIE